MQTKPFAPAPEPPTLNRQQRRHPTTAVPRQAFSIAETCAMLNITRPTVYKLLGEGRLRSVKIGTRRLIVGDSITELLNS